MVIPGNRRAANHAAPERRRSLRWVLLGCVAASALHAEPYTPVSDDEVVERLPAGFRRAEARQDQDRLANDPENLRESLALAASYLETARAEGDGRYFGFAQAVLSPWWDRDPIPTEVLFFRGRIRAGLWAFEPAGRDLDRLTALEPHHVGAQRLRFDIALCRGEWELAEQLLTRASAVTPGDDWVLARARLARLRGPVSSAESWVTSWLDSTPTLRLEERHAALGLLADLALQSGRADLARQRFEAQRSLGRRDVSATVAYGDFLLDQGEPAAVIEMANDEAASAAVALRLVVALDLLSRDDAASSIRDRRQALADQARQQLESQERRGDPSGLPESVYYRLRIEKSAGEAVSQARDLWSLRRELGDARWALSAAVAARELGLGRAVADWIRTNHIADARLKPLVEKVEAWR
jgi:hypothetical protein